MSLLEPSNRRTESVGGLLYGDHLSLPQTRKAAVPPISSRSFRGLMRPVVCFSLAMVLLTSCAFTPNARKQRYFHKAQTSFDKKEYRDAAIDLMNAIKIDPGYTDAHKLLAEVFINLEQPTNAYKEFTRTLELAPDDYRTRLELVNLLIAWRDMKDAQQQMDVLVKQRPNDPGVHMTMSSLQANQGKISDAISEVQKTIALAPNQWETYLALAILQVNSGQPNEAEANFKRVVELNPSNPQARVLLGNFYWAQRRFGDAEEQYRQTIALGPTSFLPRDALAQLYLAEGKPGQAETVLQQAIHDLPTVPDSYIALSDLYLTTGEADKALTETAELFKARPGDLRIEERYIALLVATGRFDEAHRLNEEILKGNPNDSAALIARGRMQLIAGDISGATISFQGAIKNSPDDAEAHFMLGEANHARGDMVHDQAEWQASERLNPNQVQVQRELARVAMRQGDLTALLGYAVQIIRLAPRSPDGYALRALCAINEQHYAEADAYVQQAIQADPADSLGYVEEGNLRTAQIRYADAAKAYQEALDRSPGSVDALRGLMNADIAQKEVDKAIAAAIAQIAKSPNNGTFYDLLGNALFQYKGDLPRAEAAFEKSLALDKTKSDTVVNLCMVRAAEGNLDAAIQTGEEQLKENPREVPLLLLLGDFYQEKSDWQKAANVYQTALYVDSLNPVASDELARVQLKTGGDPDIALQLAQTAAKGLPNAPRVYDTLGLAYYRKNIYPLAIANFNEAITLQQLNKMPDNAEVHFHLGLAYEKAAKPALARQHFLRALEINPHYQEADQIHKELDHLQS